MLIFPFIFFFYIQIYILTFKKKTIFNIIKNPVGYKVMKYSIKLGLKRLYISIWKNQIKLDKIATSYAIQIVR